MIRECIVTTLNDEGKVHIAPLGLIAEEGRLDHRAVQAVDHARQSARQSLRGRQFHRRCPDLRRLPHGKTRLADAAGHPRSGRVLEGALAHAELKVERVEEDEQRPRFHCRVVYEASHAPFQGFNRAQAAVIEAAILASRLHMLPREKIERELAYLQIAVEKTAGPREHEAWRLLVEKIEDHFKHARPSRVEPIHRSKSKPGVQ